MWRFQPEELTGRGGLRGTIHLGGLPATFAEVIAGWRGDADFRAAFAAELAAAPFEAFRWETPAVTTETAGRAFESVVYDSPGLAPVAEPEAFAEHFRRPAAGGVVRFANLSGDATLIVPSPQADPACYRHLAVFLREGPPAQRDELWRLVGEAMADRLSEKPVWLSTAGAGVSWLHVRLDDRPKYYGYTPYRTPPAPQDRHP